MGNKQSSNNTPAIQKRNPRTKRKLTIPLHGVSFSYLLKTFNFTQDEDFNVVCQQVKEVTVDFKDSQDRSLASYLKSDEKTSRFVKEKADVFVSYAWKGSWVETMEALKYHFHQKKLEDVFIWMDFVCVDQHKTNDLDLKDWSRVFQTSLEQIGKAVIAVVPAESPIVATRSWCCFEMSTMVRAKIKYDICISPNDTQKLIKDMQDGQIGFAKWNSLFSLVNVENSIATKTTDQVAILALMKEIGVVQVNNVVLNALKRLYVGVASEAGKEATGKALVFVLNARAELHRALGEMDESLPFHQQALKTSKSIPNNEEQTAIQLNNLAMLLNAQGKFYEAEAMYRQVLDMKAKVYGLDHPSTAITLNNLAQLLSAKGDYIEAEKLQRQALVINKKILGEEHPIVAAELNNLALLLGSKGDYVEAEMLTRESIAIGEKTLGMGHPDVAVWLNNLAGLLRDQGKLDEAKPLMEQALVIDKKVYGEDHRDVARDLNNLAQLLSDQDKDDEAEPLFRQVLEIQAKVYGPDHPSTAITLNNLAVLLRDQGKGSEARQLGKQAYAIALKSLSKDDPRIISYKYWETF